MIRPLQEGDRTAAMVLLQAAAEINLYFLGNLESYGLEQAFCQFWGDFDPRGRLRAVLNRYHTGWVIYGQADADWGGLAQVVDHHPAGAVRLQDNPGGIPSFLPYLRRYRATWVRTEEVMRLDAERFSPQPAPEGAVVRRAGPADLEALVHFYGDAEEMSRTPQAVADPLRYRRIWLAEADGVVLAAALTNAEARGLAMVGGVYTRPQARGKGLGQAVVSGLCAELLAEGLTPVLYWGNPAAGALYRKLGFRPIGTWRSVRLAPVSEGQPRPEPPDAPEGPPEPG